MSTIEKNKDNISKLYENLYLKLRRSYRENNGFVISKDIIKELQYEDTSLLDSLIEGLNDDIYFITDRSQSNNSNPNLLIGKSVFFGSWNITNLLKKKILGLIVNSTIFSNFMKSPFVENNVNLQNSRNQINYYINNSNNDIKVSDLFDKLISEFKELNNTDKDLINLSEFFKNRNIENPKKLGFKSYFKNGKFVFGDSDIVIELSDKNINRHFLTSLENKLNESKKSIAKARLELKVIKENNDGLHNKLNSTMLNIKEFDKMELELTKEFAIAGNDIKVNHQSKDDVMSMIFTERDTQRTEKEVIELKLNLINIEKTYLEGIIDYHNQLVINYEYKIELVNILLNMIMISNVDIDYFKEYYHQILIMMNNLNEISKSELKITSLLSNTLDTINKEIKDECLLSIFKILNSSFYISNSEQIYDNFMLIKRSINEYDLELGNNIFNHSTIRTMLKEIESYVSSKDSSSNKFIQFTTINHLNSSLIITILTLINQEKKMGFDVFDQLRINYFNLVKMYDSIQDSLENNYKSFADPFYLMKNPESNINYYYKSKDSTNKSYQICISQKHKLDSKLNQLRNSLSLDKKERLHLKSHINDFIRFNVIFDNNTSDSGIIIRNEPIKMTLDQSISGTTPVIYNEALIRFYDDFKEKFITIDSFDEKVKDIKEKINEFREIQLLGRPGPIGEVGPIGPRGDIGLTGEKGEIGEQGPAGERGERGPKGERGPQGEIGLRGPQGEKGETGLRGPQGETGPRGDPFTYDDFTKEQIESLRGPKGDIGEKGEQGESFKFKHFTKDQLRLLKGEKGDRGQKGERGYTGSKGDKGDTGERGPKGNQGPQGERGPEGKVDLNVVADLAIEMDCLKKNVKDFVTTSCIKISNDIESKLSSKEYKEKLAEEISDSVYEKIKDKLLKDIFNANLRK